MTSIDFLWQQLSDHQNETFYTVKKLPFSYSIKGGELFVEWDKQDEVYMTGPAHIVYKGEYGYETKTITG